MGLLPNFKDTPDPNDTRMGRKGYTKFRAPDAGNWGPLPVDLSLPEALYAWFKFVIFATIINLRTERTLSSYWGKEYHYCHRQDINVRSSYISPPALLRPETEPKLLLFSPFVSHTVSPCNGNIYILKLITFTTEHCTKGPTRRITEVSQ